MHNDHIRALAQDVDDILGELEEACGLYVSACHEANREHISTGPGAPRGLAQIARPHAIYERAPQFVRFAFKGRAKLARLLNVQPANAGYKVADVHKEGE